MLLKLVGITQCKVKYYNSHSIFCALKEIHLHSIKSDELSVENIEVMFCAELHLSDLEPTRLQYILNI